MFVSVMTSKNICLKLGSAHGLLPAVGAMLDVEGAVLSFLIPSPSDPEHQLQRVLLNLQMKRPSQRSYGAMFVVDVVSAQCGPSCTILNRSKQLCYRVSILMYATREPTHDGGCPVELGRRV